MKYFLSPFQEHIQQAKAAWWPWYFLPSQKRWHQVKIQLSRLRKTCGTRRETNCRGCCDGENLAGGWQFHRRRGPTLLSFWSSVLWWDGGACKDTPCCQRRQWAGPKEANMDRQWAIQSKKCGQEPVTKHISLDQNSLPLLTSNYYLWPGKHTPANIPYFSHFAVLTQNYRISGLKGIQLSPIFFIKSWCYMFIQKNGCFSVYDVLNILLFYYKYD